MRTLEQDPYMRVAVLSDIHSNLEALTAVLAHADGSGHVDAVWTAGDIVGYGPQPSEVLALLDARGAVSVAGNHDLAACRLMETDDFNYLAARAVTWTATAISAQERTSLSALPQVRIEDGVTIVHGSLREPDREYLFHADDAGAHFELQTTTLSIVGHTHLQCWFEEFAPGAIQMGFALDGETIELKSNRMILNPGSVGQPRDGDNRAGYAIYDSDAATFTWHRVPYDIVSVQEKMRAANLPVELIERLAIGR